MKEGAIISLTGTLGSGKTVFTKGLAEGLGIKSHITSPTFTIICEYDNTPPLYHMDLYRISEPEEFEQAGGRELLGGKGISVIEWAEKIEDYLPKDIIKVNIVIEKNNERKITIENLEDEIL